MDRAPLLMPAPPGLARATRQPARSRRAGVTRRTAAERGGFAELLGILGRSPEPVTWRPPVQTPPSTSTATLCAGQPSRSGSARRVEAEFADGSRQADRFGLEHEGIDGFAHAFAFWRSRQRRWARFLLSLVLKMSSGLGGSMCPTGRALTVAGSWV